LSRTLSRRELLVTGAIGGAALALPLPDAAAAVRRKQPRDNVHCLPAYDRFRVREVLLSCSFASFSPDGERIALETPRGIEIHTRADGTRALATPPGFTLSGSAWHPDGAVLIVSGPAEDGSGPYLHSITAAGLTRLLLGHPGAARSACFSPDGRKVAFTYVNRFAHQVCMADWTGSELVNPLNLIPVEPGTDGSLDNVLGALAWHDTRAFSPDGRRLYFASDRGAGMANVSIHYIELKTGRRNRVTYDEGYAEGTVLPPDNTALYSGITRARDPAFLTMVSGPAVPSFLGFAATPTLHDQLAARKLTNIGNGDVLAVDPTYGLHGRVVGNRRLIASKLNEPVSRGTYRVIACSMSPDGTELAAAAISAVGQHVVLLRRRPRSVPLPVSVRRTRTPPGSSPLSAQPLLPVDRTMESRRGGRVTLKLDGDLAAGNFTMTLDNFSTDGVHVFAGTAAFQMAAGGAFRHTADIRRVGLESEEDSLVFYRANMRVAWQGTTDGTISSRSRSGDLAAAWDGAIFAGQDGWRIGDRGPRPVPGSLPCERATEGR
jgi:hypothetical protein